MTQAQAKYPIHVERVEFMSNGDRIVGDLFIPDTGGADTPGAALVVTGAWMTVKEQMPARYAREMASRGFLALAFDFRGWGESGGERRQFESPAAKIADIEAAVAWLSARPEVDPSRIGGLGICASSGYMVHAAAETPSLASIALVAPWLHDREIVEEIYGGADAVAGLEAKGDAAEAKYQADGLQTFALAASLTDASSVMFKAPYYTEADRGMIPEWRNEADLGFWRGWLTFDAIKVASDLRQPFLMVESEAAAAPQGAHKFYAKLAGTKREVWLDGVTQFDFYDQNKPVTAASDEAARHFRDTMDGQQASGRASVSTTVDG